MGFIIILAIFLWLCWLITNWLWKWILIAMGLVILGQICDVRNVCTNRDVNIRECPAINCQIKMSLGPNSRVQKTGNQDGNWIEVEYNGNKGYVSKELLSSCN